MIPIKIRIYGVSSCEKCSSLKKAFDYHGFPYEYLDADAAENQAICDQYNVDELPHLQAMYGDNDKVFLTHIGYISPTQFLDRVKQHQKETEAFFNLNREIARQFVDEEKIANDIKEFKNDAKKPGCNTCNKNKIK